MDSETLEDFVVVNNPLTQIEKIPEKPSLYLICLNRQIDRLKGQTDIIYIGETGDLRNRMSEYSGNWKKAGGTGHRVSENIKRLNEPIKILFKIEENLNTSREQKEDQFLLTFIEEHHELPAWNRKGPKIFHE